MSLLELVWTIFIDNALTFGNGPAMIPLLQQTLVDERGVLTSAQLLYAFAIARITPGQANVYVAATGYFLYGLLGAALTTLAIQLPGYLMLPLMHGYERLRTASWIQGLTRGLTTASVGLIFAATLSIGLKSLTGIVPLVVFLVALAMIALLKWNTLLSLLLSSIVGVILKLILG